MSPKLHEFVAELQRDGPDTPWGIRLVGGNDLDTPLIITRVEDGSPSYGVVLRGDIISKIAEYDARDLSHAEAQHLFRSAGNEIKVVVNRDNKIAYMQGFASPSLPLVSSDILDIEHSVPRKVASPFLPGAGQYEHALQLSVDSLPHTVFPKLNSSGGYVASDKVAEEKASIINQVSLNLLHVPLTSMQKCIYNVGGPYKWMYQLKYGKVKKCFSVTKIINT